jgi:hypothetical protein
MGEGSLPVRDTRQSNVLFVLAHPVNAVLAWPRPDKKSMRATGSGVRPASHLRNLLPSSGFFATKNGVRSGSERIWRDLVAPHGSLAPLLLIIVRLPLAETAFLLAFFIVLPVPAVHQTLVFCTRFRAAFEPDFASKTQLHPFPGFCTFLTLVRDQQSFMKSGWILARILTGIGAIRS